MSRGAKVFRPSDVAETNATGYPPPYDALQKRRHWRRLGDHAGLKNFGANLVRVEPGGQSSCRHAHTKEDELVLILEGELVLETEAGRETVKPGTYIGFPAATGDAHRLVNESDRDAVFLVIGDRKDGDEVVYPDVDMFGQHGADGKFRWYRKNGTAY
jgi:uncharacterized cupin superfamily protein